ncbi:MAG: phenylacetate--CoA ligase [Armatimonadetes bacterium]|jgi:phenylacetate-CoA ligase|nr:phenylacetate--CoA ligase [Armatimonadota bacterium]MDI9585427.1 phenylacetate--CoA ligase [Acidobacteriota bacterium]
MADYYQSDFLTRSQIDQAQLSSLRGAIERAKRAPHYAQALSGISPGDMKTLDDIRRLPFTTKEDLRANMPYGFLAVPRSQVVRMHYSSGTTGVATAIYHTAQDVRWWSECVARGLIGMGVTPEDVFQNMMGYGLFTGGLGLHYAAELVGCMTIPASSGNTQRQVHLMQQFDTTVVHILPSYAMRVVHYCQENGIDPANDLKIRVAVLGAEPHTENMRRRIEEALGCKVYNCYGLSEMCGPGVAMECQEQDGLHLREDHYLAEIIDPQTLEPVAPGEEGELVLTTLNRQANPLLRYRTRDITRLVDEPCACGREHRRIGRIVGRSDDMFIVKGCNIYPIQVERVLMDVEEVGSNYLITLDTVDDLDEMTIAVELSKDVFFDDVRKLEAIRQRIVHEVRSDTFVTPRVELHQPNSLPTSEGKAVRLVDNRATVTEGTN